MKKFALILATLATVAASAPAFSQSTLVLNVTITAAVARDDGTFAFLLSRRYTNADIAPSFAWEVPPELADQGCSLADRMVLLSTDPGGAVLLDFLKVSKNSPLNVHVEGCLPIKQGGSVTAPKVVKIVKKGW